jgi:hypothetical protein
MIPAQENNDATNIMFAATTIEISMDEVRDVVNLAQWITTITELFVTPLHQRYKNS